MTPPRLAVGGLCLSYGSRVALDEITLQIRPGEIFAILGPNGSGKSSFLHCLTGMVRPRRGTLQLDGVSVDFGSRALRRRLGVVFQTPSLDPYLSARENLHLGARLFGMAGREAQSRANELLAFMELHERAASRVSTLSGGMRRRLELARALIHQPSLLLLDEPTQGLDPLAFRRLWQRLLALRRAQGMTLCCITHRADEAALCDRLLIVDRGRVVACDTPQNLLRRVAGDVLLLEADEAPALAADIRSRFDLVVHLVPAADAVPPASGQPQRLLIQRENGHTLIPRLIEAFAPGRIRAVALRQPSLSDVFFQVTGHGLESNTWLPGGATEADTVLPTWQHTAPPSTAVPELSKS